MNVERILWILGSATWQQVLCGPRVSNGANADKDSVEEPWGPFQPQWGPPHPQGELPSQHRRMEPLKVNPPNANSDLEVPVINCGTLPCHANSRTDAFKTTHYRSYLAILSPSSMLYMGRRHLRSPH